MRGNTVSGDKKHSSGIKMHLEANKNRTDVFSVCHAHPKAATAFVVARKAFEKIDLPGVVFSIGKIALTDYATPSTQEVPDSISEIIE